MKKDAPCPCGSGLVYRDCCNRFFGSSQVPETAEQLMRSRYVAHYLQKDAYLLATRHPEFVEKGEAGRTRAGFRGLQWLRLEIHDRQAGGATDDSGVVEFSAHFRLQGQEGVMRERSRFRKVDGRWYYCDGDTVA